MQRVDPKKTLFGTVRVALLGPRPEEDEQLTAAKVRSQACSERLQKQARDLNETLDDAMEDLVKDLKRHA